MVNLPSPYSAILSDMTYAMKQIFPSASYYYNMDRPDFERLKSENFPRILFMINDITTDEMLHSRNVDSAPFNIILQYKETERYKASLESAQRVQNSAYDIKRGIRAYFSGQGSGTYSSFSELTSAVEQRIGFAEYMVTIDTFFTLRTEESF